MIATEIKKFRNDLGYSMGDFARCVGVPKSTYQRYEDGSAVAPKEVVRAAYELQQIDKEFFAGMDSRIVANLKDGVCPNEVRS